MNSLIVQTQREKLHTRVETLIDLPSQQMFVSRLKHLIRFCEVNPLISGILQHLQKQFPELKTGANPQIRTGPMVSSHSEEETALLGYLTLKSCAQPGRLSHHLDHIAHNLEAEGVNTISQQLRLFCQQYLWPVYYYIDEQLTAESVIQSLLIRYKHRSEWFCRRQLWDLIQSNSKKAESSLAQDLYLYLYDQGVDFHIEPSSNAGKIDLIADQKSDDPLLADAKIFDGDKRGKDYICDGFNQIYTYTQQYNEPFGYLVIFKTTGRDLHFSLSAQSRHIPSITYNNKTIFFLVIDVFDYGTSVSNRGRLKAIEITEHDLVEYRRETSIE